MLNDSEIRVGVSSCLLGDEVRFDGGHKRDRFITDMLGQFVTFVRVCPEVEMGLGTPRETLRLVEETDGIRLVTSKTRIDHTDAMERYAAKRVRALHREDLCGYILKRGSPSCGMERVKVYRKGMPTKAGSGLFAAQLAESHPNLPIEEEGRLNDARLRENFVERLFAYRRWRDFLGQRFSRGRLVAFHTAEKMNLMAHSPAEYREIGRLVAKAKDVAPKELTKQYESMFMSALEKIATTKRQVDVLQHAAGYFKKLLPKTDREELHAVIGDYRKGLIPLVVPLTLLKHHVRVHNVEYLAGQTYLQPHPKELMLRNHV